MRKKIIFLQLLVFICSIVTITATFESEALIRSEAIPMYVNAETVEASISISKGNAKCLTEVHGRNGVTKVCVTMTLQKMNNKKWQNVKTWSSTKKSRNFTFKKAASVSKGTYRVKADVKVYKGNNCETIPTKYSKTVKY